MNEDSAHEKKIALDTLERYSGAKASEFQDLVLLTNFKKYMEMFSDLSGQVIHSGSTWESCHWREEKISLLNISVGSPSAALAVDVLAHVKPTACIMLGMCGGLRRRYQLGDFMVPVGAIRDEGTSNYYFPPSVPALGNFAVQKSISATLEEQSVPYHVGTVHTTNIRFWEFDLAFREKLIEEKAQGIEMECATLFIAGYRRQVSIGALMLISDLPLNKDGIKTKESSNKIITEHAPRHLQLGIESLRKIRSNPAAKGLVQHEKIRKKKRD